ASAPGSRNRAATIAPGRGPWHRGSAAETGVRHGADPGDPLRRELATERREDGEQAEDQGQRPCSFGDGVAGYAVAVRLAQRVASARPQVWLWSGAVWCLLGVAGRQGDPELRDPGRGCLREGDHDARGPAGSLGEGKRDD